MATTRRLGRDLVGPVREPEFVVHVARPLERAHAHHVRLRAVVPAPASLAYERLANRVPDLLGVEEQPVEVEDDAVDQTGAYACSR